MIETARLRRNLLLAGASAMAILGALMGPAAAKPGSYIERHNGVWVEGGGFVITYGDTYKSCTRRCLANRKCVMLEFYRPEKKCNLYDAMRPRLKGGSSNVGIRRIRQRGSGATN